METEVNGMTKQPSYRFAGYTEAWEQKKLGAYLTVSKNRNVDGEYDKSDVLSVSGDYGIVNQIKFQGRSFAGASVLPYGIVETGDVVYTKSPLKANPYGIIKTNHGKNGIVSTLYAIYKINNGSNGVFVEYYFDDNLRLNKYLKPLVNKGAKNDMKVTDENVLKGDVIFPSLPEQTAIGSFFQDIDQLISLQQRKLEVLKEQKKTYLKLLFPAKGQTKPALRFAGFEDEWKEVKVSDIFRVTRGQVLATTEISEEKTDTHKYPVYSSQTKNEGLLGYYDKYLFETAITWTTDGANAGTVNYREGKFYSTNVNGVLLSDEGFANKVVAEILNNEAWKYVSKVGNPKLMNNVMSEISLVIPNDFREISILSTFFQDLDKAIAKQEEKVNQLKESKQTLLRKMFI